MSTKVLVVYKESAYSRYLSAKQLTRQIRKKEYWSVIRGSHDRHNATLRKVKEALVDRGLEVTAVLRSRVDHLKKVDGHFHLVVSVGGDGTFLDASHVVGKTPLLGVNSDPSRSVARFSGCDAGNFQKVLGDFLSGKSRPLSVPRLEFTLNGRKGKWPVLNDLLAATLSPAGTSRYVLRVGSQKEEQLSSGVWISTAAGSTAAIFSAGGKALPLTAAKFQFVVREAYQKKFGPRRMLRGILKRGQALEMTSYMREGRVFVDGTNLWEPFPLGAVLRVSLSSKPLRLVGLKKN